MINIEIAVYICWHFVKLINNIYYKCEVIPLGSRIVLYIVAFCKVSVDDIVYNWQARSKKIQRWLSNNILDNRKHNKTNMIKS